MNARESLERFRQQSIERFERNQRIASFEEHLARILDDPHTHTRSAARYVVDMFDHYGSREPDGGGFGGQRWKLFDDPFNGGERPLVGNEALQQSLYRALQSFAREGRPGRILMVHGPNGSGKTTAVNLLFRALEDYSRQPEGALYRFSWLFPTREVTGSRLGFGGERPQSPAGEPDSFAYLEGVDVQSILHCELRDHPLFLVPPDERAELVRTAFEKAPGGAPEASGLRRVLEGELCDKCREIYERLLTEYRGDLAQVLRHVRVERYFVSKRYRCGAVRVNPQFHVDASEVQVSADRSLANLPASLQNLNLWVPVGDLVDGNIGIVEFSDLLKRPAEANTYLLDAIETGQVNLPHSTAHLDLVMVATSNERQLLQFKKTNIWTSFKARTELIPAPYLLRYSEEMTVYREEEEVIRRHKHLAPRTVELAALWAVLTRLRRPNADNYPSEMRPLVRELTPLQKALLYDHGEAPKDLKSEERSKLQSVVPHFRMEYEGSGFYEGAVGASPREMKTVLLYCLYDGGRKCVTPMDLFGQLGELVRDKTVHEFLRIETEGQYHDADHFIQDVHGRYLRLLEEEIRESVGLVEEEEYENLFERYILNVKALAASEKIRVPTSGELVDPDQTLIQQVEQVIASGEETEGFRTSLISRIGAWRIDHPDETEVDYGALFPDLMGRLEEDYYAKRREVVVETAEGLVKYGSADFDLMEKELRERVEGTLERMKEDHGYCEHCAKDAVAYFLRSLRS